MRALLYFAVLTGLLGCGKDKVVEPLAYVPANTAYLFANLEPMPAAAMQRLQKYGAPGKEVLVEMMKETAKDLRERSAAEDADPEQIKNQEFAIKLFEALIGELVSLESPEAMLKAGLKPQPLVALYGVGAVPVYRVEVSDAKVLNATIERVLNKAEIKFTRENYGDGFLLRVGQQKLQAIIAVLAGHAVFSVAPAGASTELLGLIAPLKAGDAASAKTALKNVQQLHGLTNFGSGYLLPEKLMGFAIAQPNALEAALLALSGAPAKKLSAACQSEIASVLQKTPRISAGWTQFSAQRWDSKTVVELDPAIAKEIGAVRAALPEYGEGKVFKFGLALDPMGAVNFARAQANKVIAAPYKCEELQELNASMAKLKESASNPMIGMAALFKGFGIAIDEVQLPDSKTPSDFDAKTLKANVALFSDQPAALVSFLGSYAPQLAKLELKDDGVPKQISPELLGEFNMPMLKDVSGAALMTKQMVLLGAGDDRLTALKAVGQAKAPALGPVLEIEYGQQLFALSMAQTERSLETLEPAEAAKMRKILDMQSTMLKQIDRMEIRVNIDERGVSMHQSMMLN